MLLVKRSVVFITSVLACLVIFFNYSQQHFYIRAILTPDKYKYESYKGQTIVCSSIHNENVTNIKVARKSIWYFLQTSENRSNRNALCSALLSEPMSEETILQFYHCCIEQNDLHSLVIGPELFDRIFNSNVFDSTTCDQEEKWYVSGQNLVALASFPGSGNTWVRILLEEMTGIYTGSIYWDRHCNSFLVGSKVCPVDNVIFVKTHDANNTFQRSNCEGIGIPEDRMVFDKAVFLTRNPYNAVLAEFSRKNAGKRDTVTEDMFTEEVWDTAVATGIQRYHDHMRYWLEQYPGPLHILVYEHLQTNTIWELYKVAKFIEFPVSLKTMWCLKKDQEEQKTFLREKPNWLKPSYVYDSMKKTKFNEYLKILATSVGVKHGLDDTLESYIL